MAPVPQFAAHAWATGPRRTSRLPEGLDSVRLFHTQITSMLIYILKALKAGMKIEGFLVNSPRGLGEATQVARPVHRTRGRPRARLRLDLRTAEDVETARRYGVPVYLLTPEVVTGLGYPVVFPPRLLVAQEVDPAVDTSFPRFVVSSPEAVRSLRIEDVIVALLRIDPLAARGVAVRNRSSVEPDQLLRRVVQAELEREATRVNLQELAPAIPRVGRPLPTELLREQDATPTVIGLRA